MTCYYAKGLDGISALEHFKLLSLLEVSKFYEGKPLKWLQMYLLVQDLECVPTCSDVSTVFLSVVINNV